MAELPELTILQQQMHEALAGRRIALAEILQPKCVNVPVKTAARTLAGRRIGSVARKGKWLQMQLEPEHYLLLNLGMGADLWHYAQGSQLPAKYQFRVHLDDDCGFTCRFWWFGHVHLLSAKQLRQHKETANLGPSPLEVSAEQFIQRARQWPRSTAKALVVDQERFSGIGNAYAHDILWTARLHPLRKLADVSDEEIARLHASIQHVIQRAIKMGGLERDFYQKQGNLDRFPELMIIGYKAGKPCPQCGAKIKKIRTGATATFICPSCQPTRSSGGSRRRASGVRMAASR